MTEEGTNAWENARGFASLLGQIPSSFTTTIRSLKQDSEKGDTCSKGSIFSAARLLNSPSLRASVYFAATIFAPESLSGKSALTSKDLAQLFSPGALAAFLGVSYGYRKAKRIAQEEEWPNLTKNLATRTNLGTFLGFTIPKITPMKGLFVGCMDTIALVLFHVHDKKGFVEYRRHLKSKSLEMDLEWELSRWGCTRFEVASIIIQTLGFGAPLANAYQLGMITNDSMESKLDSEAYAFRLANVWLRSLEKTGETPDRAIRGEFYPTSDQMSRLMSLTERVRSGGANLDWLDKGKDDLTPEAAPHFASSPKGEAGEAGEEEIPEGIEE